MQTRIHFLLLLLLTALTMPAAGLRVPAFTAYTLPDAEGAHISEQNGITHWTNPAINVNWFGQFKQTGTITAQLVLRLPKDVESRLRLSVAGRLPSGDAKPTMEFIERKCGQILHRQHLRKLCQAEFMNCTRVPAICIEV